MTVYAKLYTSKLKCSKEELKKILVGSMVRNSDRKISGIIIFQGEYVVQYLESDNKELVETLMNTIQNDPRHEQVTIITEAELASRLFPLWSMLPNEDGPSKKCITEFVKRKKELGKSKIIETLDFIFEQEKFCKSFHSALE